MLSIDFSNIFSVGSKQGLTKKQFQSTKKDLKKHLDAFYTRDQYFHEVVDDKKAVREIKKYALSVRGKYDHIVVLGIGGSALGTTCLRKSLQHLYQHELPKQTLPRLHVLDNVDPVLVREVQDILNLKRTLFVVVSKSGKTPETLSHFLYFRNQILRKKLTLKNHFVFVTGSQDNPLRRIGNSEDIHVIAHGPVGGRFAVLSSVGLLPAALIGIDILGLLKGAREMRKRFVSTSFEKNYPFQVATVQYLLAKRGKTINVMMPYAQKLASFADWYRQLLAESTGKEKDRNGKKVNVGITPVKALGATDQHSQTQLYNEGPHDKLIMFIRVKDLSKKVSIPNPYKNEESLRYLKGASFNALIDAEYRGTAQAFTTYKRPNMTVSIGKVDAYHLGQLFMLFEGATAFLGEFWNIDAFNQPGVELAKVLTREILGKK